jgi:hypothetical protein
MGRPPKTGDTKTLKLAVPVALWNYLSLLAKVSPLGSSETEVGYIFSKNKLRHYKRIDTTRSRRLSLKLPTI